MRKYMIRHVKEFSLVEMFSAFAPSSPFTVPILLTPQKLASSRSSLPVCPLSYDKLSLPVMQKEHTVEKLCYWMVSNANSRPAPQTRARLVTYLSAVCATDTDCQVWHIPLCHKDHRALHRAGPPQAGWRYT